MKSPSPLAPATNAIPKARSPLHPALVHLPVALLPLSALLDLASRAWPAAELHLADVARVCLVAGVVTALIAAIAGMVDYTAIRDDSPAKRTATLHMVLNLVAVGLFCASLGLRVGRQDAAPTAWTPLSLSLVATGVLAFSGYLGGKLVYGHGVGVGRRRGADAPSSRTLSFSAPEHNAPLEIGASPFIDEGRMVRVKVGETVVTVAKSAGKLCAFQEFCPHRHGPLSEGVIVDGEVVCLWHASRFSTRTGQVTQGPAKIDLRTFAIGEHAGKVWLHVDEQDAAQAEQRRSA